MGEGASKTAKKVPTSFMDGPLVWAMKTFNNEIGNEQKLKLLFI